MKRRTIETDPPEIIRTNKPDKSPIVGRNDVQKAYLNALHHDDQIFVTGPAGTGKSYLASATGAELLREGQVKKLLVSRPMVGTEKMGYLPGEIGDKYGPWAAPILDTLEARLGSGGLIYALRAKQVEFAPLAFMRGRSWENSFIIVDEAQNMTYSQLKMVMTRVGEGSTIVVAGDLQQTDLKEQSGLHHAITIIREQGLPVRHIEFTKEHIVRSGICAMWAGAFDRYEESHP